MSPVSRMKHYQKTDFMCIMAKERQKFVKLQQFKLRKYTEKERIVTNVKRKEASLLPHKGTVNILSSGKS